MPHASSVIGRPSSSRSSASLSTCSTGDGLPSAVGNVAGSTATSPSCRYQYVHISRSSATVPSGMRTSSFRGSPSRSHIPPIHGPTATTTCSTATSPALVVTVVTAPEASDSKPVTSTPSTICAPAARALSASPSIDSRLNANPPACSCRQTVSPGARPAAGPGGGGPGAAPGGIGRPHVLADRVLAGVELGRVADALVALEHLGEVRLLRRRAERDVAGAVVVQRVGVGLPDLDPRGHELGHRGLEVVVAHDPARDARGAGG